MPVRLRITCLFTLLAMIILGIVCVATYYFSASSRLTTLKTRLTNRAITTARLLANSGQIDRSLMHRIDSLTTLSLKRKSVQAYDSTNDLLYYYNETPGDSTYITSDMLQQARNKDLLYFTTGEREVVAYAGPDNLEGIIVFCAAEDDEGNKTLQQLKHILLFSFISGTLLSFGGGFFFSGGLLEPIRKITNEVNDISAYNLDRRINTTGSKDEWYRLSDTLNQLLDRLRDGFELQRQFISNASHELSTPLTLISTQVEISLQRNRSEEEYRLVMAQVLKDVQYMNNLVQTLLKFATTSGNAGGLRLDPVRIDEVLMRLPGEMQSRTKTHSVSLYFPELPEQDEKMLVFGNEELLFTAISNIVSNACKYSPDNHADVSLYLNPEGFEISIVDKGIGIEEKELANIFQPFYRIQQNRNIKGFGLGLALASQIIKLHKGDVKVASVKGEGTTFTVLLPYVQIL
jgi:signal transduction histidine kinase